jgi:hypothetical protein
VAINGYSLKLMTIAACCLSVTVGFRYKNGDLEAWCIVNERDELGDNTPFEYATHVVEGAFYGWPWYFIGGHEDPRQAGLLPRQQLSRRIQRQCLRNDARILEPGQTDEDTRSFGCGSTARANPQANMRIS